MADGGNTKENSTASKRDTTSFEDDNTEEQTNRKDKPEPGNFKDKPTDSSKDKQQDSEVSSKNTFVDAKYKTADSEDKLMGLEKEVTAEERKVKVMQLLDIGIQCLERDENEEALKHLTEAIELDDKNPLLYINRAAAYAKMKNYDDALEDAETIVEMRPDWPEAYLRKGTIYLSEWRNRLAYCALQRGLKVDPENERLGRAYFESKLRMQMVKDKNYPKHMSHPLKDKSTHEELRKNPVTRGFMEDPEFVKMLNKIRRDRQLLLDMQKTDDKRYVVCVSIAMGLDVNAGEADWSDGTDPEQHAKDLSRFNYLYIERYDPVREIVIPPPLKPKAKTSPQSPSMASDMLFFSNFSLPDLSMQMPTFPSVPPRE